MTDPFDLERFVAAQDEVYASVLAELRRGRKQTHWMWFVFPQLQGLGTSVTARHYAIASFGEAAAFLDHPVLGARYRECVTALQDLHLADPVAVFGTIDARKFHSSLTLMAAVDHTPLFIAALDRWFGGRHDARTTAIMASEPLPSQSSLS